MQRSPRIECTHQLIQANGHLSGGGSDTNFQYAYAYDAIGNYTQTTVNSELETWNPNPLNQYTNTTTRPTLAYDPNGNLLDDSQLTYGWDQESRLVLVSNVDAHAESVYNGLGWKVEQREYTNGALATTTRYLYDGVLPIVETDESNTTVRTITRGLDLSGSMQGAGGIGGLLALTTHGAADTNNYYYFYDGNGNVVDLIDENDASVAHYEYDPFGNTRIATGSLANQPYRFSSKEHVDVAGLYYYGYRFYSPALGRWVSRDPIMELGALLTASYFEVDDDDLIDGGQARVILANSYNFEVFLDLGVAFNRYLGLLNDPINAIDPDGLMARRPPKKKDKPKQKPWEPWDPAKNPAPWEPDPGSLGRNTCPGNFDNTVEGTLPAD